MKKLVFFCIICLSILLTACQQKSQVSQSSDAHETNGILNLVTDSNFIQALNLDSAKVDLTIDFSQLSYQNLRLLKSYVYAIHAHWFKEGELNRFFTSNTSWYEELCYQGIEGDWDKMTQEEQVFYETYIHLWEEDYDKAMQMIKLTDEERDFVARIDNRMSELMKQKNFKTEEGTTLINPSLLVNWFQMGQPSDDLFSHLYQSNVAFVPTKLEQLFQVYEENEYTMMPNFITTDLLLQAYHMYFNYTLSTIERHLLSPKLVTIFTDLLHQNSVQQPKAANIEDMKSIQQKVAAFAIVALHLLGHDVETPADIADICQLELDLVQMAEDAVSPLFQTPIKFNYSLFRPRGRYTRTEADQRYFRAMMWMQKGCFDRSKEDQLKQAIYLAWLLNNLSAEAKNELQEMNRTISFLMGQPNNLSIIELAEVLKQIKVSSLQETLSAATIARVEQWLDKAIVGRSSISRKQGDNNPQLILNLLPQRYTLDGEILGSLYDSVPNAKRGFPMGLDVFSAFGTEAATRLLDTCYHTTDIWPDYSDRAKTLRKKMEQFDEWDATFYNKWLQDLMVLQRPDKQQPGFMQTSTWKKKNLNTGLASWALLKHDAILYAEQPICAECGGGGLPEPQQVGYVEPNILFWEKMLETIQLNRSMLEENHMMTDALEERTNQMEGYITFCLRVAKNEIEHKPISNEDYSTIEHIGADIEYFTLSVLDPDKEIYEWQLIEGADRKVNQVADVFTRNVLGCQRSGILYEATGYPHAIYVVVEIEGKCYLTRGATYSYYEFVRPLDMPRLTDEEWQEMGEKEQMPPTTEWFAPLLVGNGDEPSQRYVYSTGC